MTAKVTPNLVDVIRRAMDLRLADMHVALPGRVESYDSATQKANVKPLIQSAVENEEGELVAESLPVIPGVPVQFPGAGGYRLTFPVAKGDTVLLVFSEASLDKWLSRGDEVDPLDYKRFDISDAIAIPGLRAFSNPLANAPTDRLSLGADAGASIEITQALVKLGGNAAVDAVLKGTAWQTTWASVITTITAALVTLATAGTTWAAVSPPTGAANGTYAGAVNVFATVIKDAFATLNTALTSNLSTKVKTE